MLGSDVLVHTATIERFQADGVVGASYAVPASIDCYFEGGSALVDNVEGVELGLDGKLFTNETDLPVGTRVQVLGKTGYVTEAKQLDDLGGLGHTEVTVSAQPRAAATRSAIVSLAKAATAAWSDVDEATTTTSPTPYASDLAARITSLVTRSRDADVDAAEETLRFAQYLVTVYHDVEPYEGDEVTVDTCAGDPSLEGRRLLILSVVRGTSRVERDMFCQLIDAPRPD